MLDDASLQADEFVNTSLSGVVQVRERDLCGAVDRSPDAGNTEATFLICRKSFVLQYLWVHHKTKTFADVVDEERLAKAHLWCGQADARRFHEVFH